MGRSLFKVPSHQKFEYKPRYWNPDKERMEEMRDRIRSIQSEDVDGTKARISSRLKGRYGGDPRLRSQLTRQSNFRIFGIVIVLVILCAVLYSSYLDKLFEFLG